MKAPKTVKPKRIYRWITWHAHPERAVQTLSNQQLRILNGHLAKVGVKGGIPSVIYGLIRNEAATRLMIQKDAKDQ